MTTFLPVRQHTDEWLAVRRSGITGTDIPVLLGISPYKSEGQLAREKAGQEADEEPSPERARMMRVGLLLEEVIRDEDRLEHGIPLRRVNRLAVHPDLRWAVASLDFERVGERTIVEAKSTRSRKGDELDQAWEAQVRWQMGVAGYPRAHVATLVAGSTLRCYDIEHDEALFADLVTVAEDFRARLVAGGPFTESLASVRDLHPRDDGTETVADSEVTDAVRALIRTRSERKRLEEAEEALEAAVKARMGDHAYMVGPGFRITWKRTKDAEVVDWKSVASGLLTTIPEPERAALVGIHTSVRPGFRPFRLVEEASE